MRWVKKQLAFAGEAVILCLFYVLGAEKYVCEEKACRYALGYLPVGGFCGILPVACFERNYDAVFGIGGIGLYAQSVGRKIA